MMNTMIAQINLGESLKIGTQNASDVFSTPADLINKLILPNIFVFAGLIFLALLIGGAFSILRSGDSKGLEKAREQVMNAAIGFIIVFVAYWLVQLIGVLIGQPII